MAKALGLSEFHIIGLRGATNVDVHLKDNTLILVGENGSGKTTFLRILFAFLSGRWHGLTQFEFDSIEANINGDHYSISRHDISKIFSGTLDSSIMNRLPQNARRRVIELLDTGKVDEARAFAQHYADRAIGTSLVQPQLFKVEDEDLSNQLVQMQEKITNALNAQILYLPTYRRIERELGSIFQGIDQDDLRRSRMTRNREDGDDYVELVEFGMGDVKVAIDRALEEIGAFARLGATRLTLSYLGDVVSQNYRSTARQEISDASSETIEAVLNRVDDTILSLEHKTHLQDIILAAKTTSNVPSEHEQIIYHYFSKLLRFQSDLQQREKNITAFCELCSNYIESKEFIYNSLEFTFSVKDRRNRRDVQLSDLSSGEKQIVSLFSHLYLSQKRRFYVLIDEPELSLSVPWQRRFLLDVRNGEFCAGLVAVTHSPFIYDNQLRAHTHALGEFVSGPDWGNIN